MVLLTTMQGDSYFYKIENNTKSQHFHNFTKCDEVVPFDFLTDTRGKQKLKRFVVVGSDSEEIKIWSVETMECVETIKSEEGNIVSLACHPNEMKFITGGDQYDTSIKLWC